MKNGTKLRSFASGFKEVFKREREKAGYTQKSFAEYFDVSLDTVRNWEQGRKVPEMKTIERLCAEFSCEPDYLLGRMKSSTHDIQFISDYTGLNEKAVTNLAQLKGTPLILLLNYLITNKGLLEKLTTYYASRFSPALDEKPYLYIRGDPSKIDERLFYADIFSALPLDRENFYDEYKEDHEVSKRMAFTLINQSVNESDFVGWLQILHDHVEKDGPESLKEAFLSVVSEFCEFRGDGEYLQRICDTALEKYNKRAKGDGSSGTD